MSNSRVSYEGLYNDMHAFAFRNHRFADGAVHSIDVRISETIDFQELAYNALRSIAEPGEPIGYPGSTIMDEEELLTVEHTFKANRLTDFDMHADALVFRGTTTVKRDNIVIPRHLGVTPEGMDDDDDLLGSQESTMRYSVARNPHTGEVEFETDQQFTYYDDEGDVLVSSDSKDVPAEDAGYSRLIAMFSDDDQDDDPFGEPKLYQYVDIALQQRLNHEALAIDTAEELSVLVLLPDSLHNFELYTFLERRDLVYAAVSFRALTKAIREQAGR